MIHLYRSKYAPSLLLNCDEIPSIINDLLNESRVYRNRYEWMEAEQCALEAKGFCQKENWRIGLALAQIHLGDCYAEIGEIGKGLEQYKAAHRTLNWLSSSSRQQLQNRAVAAYALGLLNELQIFGDRIETLRRYKEALQLFKKAQEFWTVQRDQQHFNICKNIISQIEKQIQNIRADGQVMIGTLDVLHLDSVKTPYDRDIQGYILDDSYVEIGKTNYRLHSGTLSSNDDNARYCFALPVQGKLKGFPAAQDSDYVIVRLHWWLDQDRSRELANAWLSGVVWSPNTGWDVGDFTETPSGRTWFYPSATEAQIIGDEKTEAKAKDPTGAIKGYIIGLLKPDTTPPPEPSTTASTAPPSESSTSASGEPPETESIHQGPDDDIVTPEAERDIQAISSTQIEVLDAVWLFSDDLDALHRLLKSSGSVNVSTNKAQREEQSQVLEDLPVDWLHLSVPESDMSIIVRPRQVEIRRPNEQGESGDDLVKSVREFIASRRHPLHFLGKRGWQLGVAFLGSALLLPITFSQLLLNRANDILKALGFFGVLVLGILGAIALVGRYIPSNSHVTLWKLAREKFSYGVQRVAWYLLRVGGVFFFGAIVGSWVRAGGWGWFGFLGAVIVLSAVIWLFGLSVQRVEH